ncbi:GNAT family N-acetyltransferase [Halobacterium yunchengense]|uniref:GNAT family N-acetyltransferase n=1 Tax=Halobacterium yunchengense TaxID=3108497 RepID=UPI003009AF87
MPEFRPVPDEDLDAFRRIVRYAFRADRGPRDDADDDGLPPGAEIGDRYGRYDGDELVATCKHIDFRTRLRGDVHDLHGLSVVASPPEHRRRGHVGALLADSLAQSRGEGVHLSALWPFKRSFYAKYGWATGTRAVRHELDVEALSFAPPYDGEFVRLDEDDWERVDAVHDAHGARYELTMDRTEEWWRKRVFAGWDDDPYVYGFERGGDLAAYLTYDVRDDDEPALRVMDWACVDHDARLAVLRFVADHDSQVETASVWTSPTEDLLDLAPDGADGVDATLRLGPMVRLVDVADALEALSYPEEVTLDAVFDVSDPLADWNDDAFRVTVSGGTASVERADREADVALGVGALSQLSVGYRSASELEAVGDVDADPGVVDALDDAFPERQPFLREGF